MRSFVAVLLPEALRLRVAMVADDLRRLGSAVSWVRPDNIHLTLRFLGAIDEPTVGRVREALEETAAATAPFPLTLGGLGGFPPRGAPRVVWVGVIAGADLLAGLHARVEASLARQGLPPEARGFHAHVTLGRARDPRGAPALAPALAGAPEALGAMPPGAMPLGAMVVEAVHLMRSDLRPQGAQYGVLARVALAGAPARFDFAQGGS